MAYHYMMTTVIIAFYFWTNESFYEYKIKDFKMINQVDDWSFDN